MKEKSRARLVKTSGTSMLPLIGPDSSVSIQAVRAGEVRPGEIAAFRIGDDLYLHRILDIRSEKGETLVRQKGDNQLLSTWIPEEDCEGRATWLFRKNSRRFLAPDPHSFSVRALTTLSRLEANLFESLRGGLRKTPDGTVRGGRTAARFGELLLLPVKILLLPLVFAAYGRVSEEEEGNENKLLLWCLGKGIGREKRQDGPPQEGDVDPYVLSHAASLHGVAPLLAEWIASGRISFPGSGEVLTALRPLLRRSALTSHDLRQTTADAVRALEGAGVDFAVLKGPGLSLSLYEQESLRPVSDVDILVASGERKKAVAALAEAGYEGRTDGIAGRLLGWIHFHYALRPKKKNRLLVELHWGLVDRVNLYRLPGEELLDKREEAGKGDFIFPVLPREENLLYLCLHAAKHGLLNARGLKKNRSAEWFCRPWTGNRLIWFLDILLFMELNGDSLNWESLRAKASAWNAVEDVKTCLKVMEKLFPGGAGAALRAFAPGDGEDEPAGTSPPSSRLAISLLPRAMEMDEHLLFRPARILSLARVFFPSPAGLKGFYGVRHPLAPVLLYPLHPFVMTARLLGINTP